MVPPESLSQCLSNEYQCYGVSDQWSRKITNIFCILILVTKVYLFLKNIELRAERQLGHY
jgi:hypothetical protein